MLRTNPKDIKGALLTIGDEVLQGDIPNGNAHHIASTLRASGFRLDRMITVGDREEDIVPALSQCLDRSRFVIATGGLGPTDDDRTGVAVSRALGLPLVCDAEALRRLRERSAREGRAWSERVGRMAMLPEGAVAIGLETAGFCLEAAGIPCYFLPGVPYEMKGLLARIVLPDLARRFPDRPLYRKHILRVQGLVESEINDRLKNSAAGSWEGLEVGYLPQSGEIWVTLLASAENEERLRTLLEEADREIVACLGSRHITGRNGECLEVVIGERLRAKGWKLTLAESCTGGKVSGRIASVPGASDYLDRAFVTYSNQAKMDLLGVPREMLEVHGAVSEPVALSMANGACRVSGVEVAVAITGIAGPTGGSPEKPVGTVFMACVAPCGQTVEVHQFDGDRETIQESSVLAALALLWRMLSE